MATATVQQKQIPWWLVLIQGIAAVVIGIFLLTAPAKTTVILVQFLGIYWLISGIFSIVAIFLDKTAWGWKLFSGILGIIAGIIIIQHPLWSTLIVPGVLVIILGLMGLIIGVVGLIQAFQGAGWGAGILGALSIILGILLLSNSFVATLALPWVFGIFAITGGLVSIVQAFRMR